MSDRSEFEEEWRRFEDDLLHARYQPAKFEYRAGFLAACKLIKSECYESVCQFDSGPKVVKVSRIDDLREQAERGE